MKLISSFILALWAQNSVALEVAATTTDMQQLALRVGGPNVKVQVFVKGAEDPHQIEAKPSFMVKLRKTDLLVSQGLELEAAWVGPLIDGARNPKFADVKSRLELGALLDPIEKATSPVSREHGDVHPDGNPHFQLDPERMAKAAEILAARLAEIDGAHKEDYEKNGKTVSAELRSRIKGWTDRIEKSGQKEIVTYHKTFSYFCDRFQIVCSTQLEPKPGLPPSAGHLLKVIGHLKEKNIRVILIENYYDDASIAKLKESIPNLIIERVPVSVGGEPGIEKTEDLIERLVKVIERAKSG